MKRAGFGVWLSGLMLVFLVFPAVSSAQNTQNFTIESFGADYYLDRDTLNTSTLHTVEVITARFPDFDQNHGILRALPESYQDHTVSLNVDGVTDENGSPVNYTTYGQNGNLVLKIGDAGAYVHGLKTYKITYDARNVAAIFADHDEFYWNVNGDQWQQPFLNVQARAHIPQDLSGALQDRQACYAGANGSADTSRCQISAGKDSTGGTLVTAEAKNLGPGETLTLVKGFKPGTFALGPEIAKEKRDKQLKYAAIAGGTIAPSLLAGAFLFHRWRKYGRDPKGRGVIIPEYQPPKGLNVLTSDYVMLEKLDNKAISALIVELAVRKYLTIYEVPQKKRLQKDTVKYKLKLIKDPAGLTPEEQKVINMFFTSNEVGTEADLSLLSNKLSGGVKDLKKTLGTNLSAQGYFRGDPNKASVSYYGIGTVLAAGGFFLLTTGLFVLIALSTALAGLMFLVFSRYMPSRSQLGVTVRDHMLGLKDYIKLAEADRLKFLQSPQGAEKIQEAGLSPADPRFKVKLFESLLPYAVLFNLEKAWAKQFEDVYKQAPDWYSGNWGTFNAVYLASSIGGFSSVSSVAFSPPHSSGGSGFGGGFSGGGGGGGGGGGW